MSHLLTILLAFYPTIFLYSSIPQTWMKKVDALAATGTPMFFFVHLAVFGALFFVIHSVLKKFLGGSIARSPRSGAVGVILMTVFTLAIVAIAFYNVLPGDILYHSPALVDKYLLKNPYTLIALVAPFIYLFFD
jgi:hypothetical protein